MTSSNPFYRKDPIFRFLERAPHMGAHCGILVWEMEDGTGFIEKARFGYGEEGHFYEFMSRGKGNLEKLKEFQDAIIFSRKEGNLFHSLSKFAVAAGVFHSQKMVGFLILELEGEEEKGRELAFLLARFLDPPEIQIKEIPVRQKSNSESKSDDAIGILWRSYPGLQKTLDGSESGSPVLILGPSGSGKKALTRYLHKTGDYQGDILVISTIPENLGKLEKSLQSWEELAMPKGMIVFDKIRNLSLGQQRIFYEWIVETRFSGRVFFLEEGLSPQEKYPPFWEILERTVLELPGLDEVPRTALENMIDTLFLEICRISGREGLELSPGFKEKLLDVSLPGNLEELRNHLSRAIWTSKGKVVTGEEWGDKSDPLPAPDLPSIDDLDLPKNIAALERQKILIAQKLFSGNQMRMAKALKISRGALQYKMKNLGL